MPTYIYDKKDFIDFIKAQVKDDEVVVFTDELTGNASFSKKKGSIVSHQYSPDTFNDDGIGHIAFGKTTALGVLIATKSRLSPKAKEAMVNIKNS